MPKLRVARKNEELAKINKLKTQFFANISHEFRTPLTLILGPVQDMLHDPFNKLPTKINDIFNLIQQNGLRLLRLVNDLLDIIRLEEGKANLKLQKLEVNSLIAGIADSMIHLADIQQINVEKEILEEEIFIQADPIAIDKIIINILNNAIKFTPKGGKVNISTSKEKSKLIIKIKDTGIGIDQKNIANIFDRFAQVDSSSTREYQGTGIGLALVKELIELQKGTISVSSSIGKGSEFIIQFNLYDENNLIVNEDSSKDKNASNKLANVHKAAQRIGGLTNHNESKIFQDSNFIKNSKNKIVVVDDEVDMRNYIINLLENQKYKVLSANDGKQGIEIIKQTIPDLVILDLMLPKIDGLEVCKELKKIKKLNL